MNYEQKYKDALERAKAMIKVAASQDEAISFVNTIFPELAESGDEKIRKWIINEIKIKHHNLNEDDVDFVDKAIFWLEKQGTSYTKRDVDDAYLEGMAFAKDQLEKQSSINNLSEEVQNRFAKGVLTSCALSFIDYLDAHKYEGKMCVSNGECEDIENAFHNAMWDRLHRYYCKYIEKQDEQKPWSEEDEKIQNTTISFLSEYAAKGYENAVMCIDWLKSLKERIGG